MTDDEAIEFERLKTARDSLLLNVANLRVQLETIAAKEREACAKVAEQVGQHKNHIGIAAAIRARGRTHD